MAQCIIFIALFLAIIKKLENSLFLINYRHSKINGIRIFNYVTFSFKLMFID